VNPFDIYDFTKLIEYSRLSQLVETVSKKPIPKHQKNVIFEITAEDQTEEDVEVPYVMLKLRS
jgi:ubiquitin-activating enzyme E1